MYKNAVLKELLDWLVHIAIAVAIGLIIVNFVAQRTVVFKQSMEPTLFEGDNILVEKISPRLGKINRGDIVVVKNASPMFEREGKELIKRVIAIENDTLELKDGKVYLNGKELEEDYVKDNYTPMSQNEENNRVTIKKGYVYVMGDNRINSIDSRSFGLVKIENIRGRAIFRFFPFNRIGGL